MPVIDEFLRFEPSNQLSNRRALKDTQIGGVDIPAGSLLTLCIGAANRDPARWERPEVLDPDRPRLWGHLAFNVGPRHCAGAHLARMEATEAISGLWRAFPDLARAPRAADPTPVGFVSRAWRPVALSHSPVPAAVARERVLAGPPWAGSVPPN